MKNLALKTKIKMLLRWICVLPGAIISASSTIFLIFIYLAILADFHCQSSDCFLFERIYLLTLVPYIAGFLFIKTGTSIAPKYKNICSYALLLIGIIFCAFQLHSAFITRHYELIWPVTVLSISLTISAYTIDK